MTATHTPALVRSLSGAGHFFALAMLLNSGCAYAPAGRVERLPLTASNWRLEAEGTTQLSFGGGEIDLASEKGATLWFARPMSGRMAIGFDAMAVAHSGPWDAVSDLNAFWMASEPGGAEALTARDGRFESYDSMLTYYVGIGGNRNTTTRMRRYTGRTGDRPLLPQHDLGGAANMVKPNVWTRVRLIADNETIAVERDSRRVFTMTDPAPYRVGYFGLRTTQSHFRYRNITLEILP